MTPEAWFEAIAVALIIAGWVFTGIVARLPQLGMRFG